MVAIDDASVVTALRWSFMHMIWMGLTESCPDRYWGASLSMLGLMGDVTEMDGRSIFWDSKELEPVNANIIQWHSGIKQEEEICRHSLDSSCACVLSGILGISLERKKSVRQKGVVGRDQFDLMLTVECFNDCKSCINLHSPNSSLSSTKQLTYRSWQSEGYCCFYPLLSTSKTIGGEVHSAVQWCSLHQHQREEEMNEHLFRYSFSSESPHYRE